MKLRGSRFASLLLLWTILFATAAPHAFEVSGSQKVLPTGNLVVGCSSSGVTSQAVSWRLAQPDTAIISQRNRIVLSRSIYRPVGR